MSQAERLSRIHFLLRDNGEVSLKELKDALEVSRATLMRDIELMRDRLGAPLIYDSARRVYRYDTRAPFGQRLGELPGLWISAEEGYALLTLYNVVCAIDPGFLTYFLLPMRKTIKRLLVKGDFQMWSLDKKVVIDLPKFSRIDGNRLSPIFAALVKDTIVRLVWIDANNIEHEEDCRVIQLTLQETGWQLAIQPKGEVIVSVGLEHVRPCNAIV